VPLIGIVDPSHNAEKSFGSVGQLPRWVTLDEALENVSRGIKWAPWTYELMSAIFAEHQERGDLITASALVAADPRAEVMKRKEDYVEHLKNLYIPFRGTMVHRTMEYHSHGSAIAEARFYTTIDGITVSCSPDLLTEDTLFDYKVTEVPPMYQYPYVHHKEQVELNAFIARHAESWDLPDGVSELPFDPRQHPVEHVALVYMGPKYVKVLEVEKKEELFDPKKGAFKSAYVPFVWPDRLVLSVFRPRIHIFQNALRDYPGWPEPWVDVENIDKKTGEPRVWTAEEVWGGEKGYECPGEPLCMLPSCIARRKRTRLVWPKAGVKAKDLEDGQ
jgi:hypothetical protein